MRIRLYNARILTMEDEKEIFFGELWVQDGHILKVIAYNDSPEESKGTLHIDYNSLIWDQEIDCHDNLLMPGFKNAHTHSAMTFLRSFADDLPLDEWLHNKIFPMEAKLTSEDIMLFTKLAILEYLAGGTTSIFDMYIDPMAVGKACEELGMRCVLVPGLNDFTLSLKEVETQFLNYKDSKSLVTYVLGCHAEYTCSRELLEGLAVLAKKYKSPVYLHLSETEKEVKACKEKYGMSPIAFLNSLGMFDYGGGGYHGLYLEDGDIEILKSKRVSIVTNPASNLKLASGIAPIQKYLDNGIEVGIGTDGPASNNCLDLFREMFLVSALAKVKTMDASAVSAKDVLRMATVGSAKAMRLFECDVLKEGKCADLCLIDLHMPNMQPIHNIEKNLVYSGNKSNVLLTMIHGKILYKDGKYYLPESADSIYKQCEVALKRMLAK